MVPAVLAGALLSATTVFLIARATRWASWRVPGRAAPVIRAPWGWAVLGLFTGPLGIALLFAERRHVQPLGLPWDHAEAGWHADPFGHHRQRFWDGEEWTAYGRGARIRPLHPLVAVAVVAVCVGVWSGLDLTRGPLAAGLGAATSAPSTASTASGSVQDSAATTVRAGFTMRSGDVACAVVTQVASRRVGVRCGTQEAGSALELFAGGRTSAAPAWSWPRGTPPAGVPRAGRPVTITAQGTVAAGTARDALVRCVVVRREGVRCRNGENHGFFVSAAEQRRF
jgi:hypothetical protein